MNITEQKKDRETISLSLTKLVECRIFRLLFKYLFPIVRFLDSLRPPNQNARYFGAEQFSLLQVRNYYDLCVF